MDFRMSFGRASKVVSARPAISSGVVTTGQSADRSSRTRQRHYGPRARRRRRVFSGEPIPFMIGRVNVVVIGAGPYGLSVTAHLQGAGIEPCVFGQPMVFWKESMPMKMILRSR